MKLNEVTEPGFYISQDYPGYIFEVMENTDEKWLEEESDKTLLIDEWMYDYLDNEGRKVYACQGTVIGVFGAEPLEVEKLDREFELFGNMNALMREVNSTYKEKIQLAIEQMKNDIKRYEGSGEYDKGDFIINIKDYIEILGEE